MSSKNHFLSVVVPVYNESKRIANIPKIAKYLLKQQFTSELIIVNDGSIDDTSQKIIEYKKRFKLRLISYKKNRGKGYAVKKGVLASQGGYILLTDIDLSTPLREIRKFLFHTAHFDVLIATRKSKHSKLLQRQPLFRELLGKGFTNLSNLSLGLCFSDFTCGFKIFSKKCAKQIFSKVTIDGWGFDTEVLFIAKMKNFSVKEIPVFWRNDPKSKVKFPNDLIQSFLDLIRIKINNHKDRYK